MKTMYDYTLLCTPEQTKKALELGAPIRNFITKEESKRLVDKAKSENRIDEYENELLKYHQTIIDDMVYCIPTAEQMMGFFRSKNIHIVIHKDVVDDWSAYGHEIAPIEFTVFDRLVGFNSFEEATIAAIDAALNYLTNNEK